MSFLDQLFGLHGKTILVTGASRGIGLVLADSLAQAGARVIRSVRTIPDASAGDVHEYVLCELSDKASVGSCIARATEAYGPIDGLVNCGGINRRFPAEEFPEEEYLEVMQVNLHATWRLCRDFAKACLERGSTGAIVNLACASLSRTCAATASLCTLLLTVTALMSHQGGLGVSAYTATKHAIVGLTRNFSNEWRPRGIRVNAIAPGYVATELITALRADEGRNREILARTPAGRYGTPEDLVGACILLLADKASGWTSGETILIDGGWLAR